MEWYQTVDLLSIAGGDSEEGLASIGVFSDLFREAAVGKEPVQDRFSIGLHSI